MKITHWVFLSFILSIFVCACDKDEDAYLINTEDGVSLPQIISFENLSADTLNADSLSVSTITVKLNPNSDSAKRYILCHTTLGKFSNGDTEMIIFANSLGVANVSLYSNTPGIAALRFSIGAISIDTAIVFTPALPQNMQFAFDATIKFPIDSTASLPLTCLLSRKMNSKVSNNLFVYFEVTRTDTLKGGNLVMPTYAFTHNGQAIATVTNPYNVHGSFKITASTLSDSANQSISRTINISVK